MGRAASLLNSIDTNRNFFETNFKYNKVDTKSYSLYKLSHASGREKEFFKWRHGYCLA